MINVFISHNYKDKPMARKIAKELDKYGIKVWIDESEIRFANWKNKRRFRSYGFFDSVDFRKFSAFRMGKKGTGYCNEQGNRW